MSFGGGREQYTLEYIVKVVNQGGAGGINQINQGFQQTASAANNATVSSEKLAAAANRVSQAQMGMTKAVKSTAFGFFGMTTAGAEMIGMLSMWQQTQTAVKEAQDEQNTALKEGGKESKAYKDATAEVVKMNRWAAMTQRNFMLSIFDMVPFTIMAVHGLTKMVTAMKALKEARAAAASLRLLGFDAGGVAAQMLKANTSIGGFVPSISKYSAATTIARTNTFKLGAETVKTTKFFGAGEAALLSNAIAMGKVQKSATSTSKAMRVLGIAMKVAIPLIALEVGAQAFANNWGGFRDKINAVGVAIGNTIPALKGMLGWIDKIGRSIVAIFTGDFESIGSIWDTDKMEAGIQLTDQQRKKIDELNKSISEATTSASEMVNEIALGDKKARKQFFKDIGITTGKTQFDDAKKGAKEYFKALETGLENLQNVGKQFQTLRQINLLEKFGLVVDDDVIKKIRYSMEDKLRNAFEGDKGIFEDLADVVAKNAKASRPEFNAAIAEFASDHPGLVTALKEAGLGDLATEVQAIIDEQKLGEVVGKSLQNAFTTGDILNPNSGKNKGFVPGSAFAEAAGQTDAGIFKPIVDKIKEGIKGLAGAIEATDWNAVGQALGNKLDTLFNAETGLKIGNAINTYVIVPAEKFIAGFGGRLAAAAAPWIEEFKKDPIGALFGPGGLTQPAGDFVAGLLGYNSEAEMHIHWATKLKEYSEKFVQYFRDYFNEQELSKTEPGTGGVDMGQGVWFVNWTTPIVEGIQKGYATFLVNLETDPNVQAIRRWFHDPVGALLTLIQTLGNVAKETKAAEVKPMDVYTLDEFLKDSGIQKWLDSLPTFDDIQKKVLENPSVKAISDAFNAMKQGGQAFLDWIWSAGGNVAFGDTGNPNKGPGRKHFELDDADFDKLFNEITIPELPPNLNFNAPPNSTPTLTFSSFTADLSQAKITSVLNPSGSGPGDIPNSPPPTHGPSDPFNKRGLNQLLISVPSATVVPQTVTVAIDWASIMTSAGVAMAAIEQGWINLMTNMSSLANTTVQAIALVFGGMAINISAGMTGLANTWSAVANSFMNNASAAGNGIINNMESAMSDVESKMSDLASHWSKMCNSMIANAKSAAKGIEKAMDSIPDTESVHTIRVRRVYEFAEGGEMTGAISAAGGRILTTHGEQMFKIGDNPGGTESVWAIPHNRPGPIVEQINATYGGGAGGGGSELNQTLILNVKGSDLVNSAKIEKKIRTTIGDKRDRYGGV